MNEPFLYNGYNIRATLATDYTALELLYKSVYQNTCCKGFYEKKYTNYDKSIPHVISFVAVTKDGEIIACSSLIPVKMEKKNQVFIAAQWADAMVHSSYQKKGIGLLLCKACMEKAKQIGIEMIFCLPVEATFNLVTTKLQHQFVSNMLCYNIKINTLPLASIANKLKLEKLHSSFVNSLFDKYKTHDYSLFNSFSKEYLSVFRDELFISDKEKSGSFFIKIGETFVWLSLKKGALFIGDIISPSEDSFKQAINSLKKICFYTGIRNIIFQTIKGTKTESYFSNHFPAIDSYKICAISFNDAVNINHLQLTFGDADNF